VRGKRRREKKREKQRGKGRERRHGGRRESVGRRGRSGRRRETTGSFPCLTTTLVTLQLISLSLDELTRRFPRVERVRSASRRQESACVSKEKRLRRKRKMLTHREVPTLTILGHPSRDFSNRTHSCRSKEGGLKKVSKDSTGRTGEKGEKEEWTNSAVVSVRDSCKLDQHMSVPFFERREWRGREERKGRRAKNAPCPPQIMHLPPYVPKLHSSQILTSSAGRT
jgi:hypothetical protein